MENVYDEVLTLKESAEIIGIKLGTLYQWRNTRVISQDKRYRKSYVLEIQDKWIKNELFV